MRKSLLSVALFLFVGGWSAQAQSHTRPTPKAATPAPSQTQSPVPAPAPGAAPAQAPSAAPAPSVAPAAGAAPAGSAAASATAADVANSQDYPGLPRMLNFLIREYHQEPDSEDLPITASSKIKTVKGLKTEIHYGINEALKARLPAAAAIMRTYQTAITKMGGKVILQTPEGLTAQLMKGGKEIWVRVDEFFEPATVGQVGTYRLLVMEGETSEANLTDKEMFETFRDKGVLVLHPVFAPGKASIKSESDKLLEQLAKMLKAHAGLKVSIEGHTNAGDANAQKLSEERAEAVMKVLTKADIQPNRLTAIGYGDTKPLEGGAESQRIEIVKPEAVKAVPRPPKKK